MTPLASAWLLAPLALAAACAAAPTGVFWEVDRSTPPVPDVKWAMECAWEINDAPKKVEEDFATPGERCGEECHKREWCTHFQYNDGRCTYRAFAPDPIVKTNIPGHMCGFIENRIWVVVKVGNEKMKSKTCKGEDMLLEAVKQCAEQGLSGECKSEASCGDRVLQLRIVSTAPRFRDVLVNALQGSFKEGTTQVEDTEFVTCGISTFPRVTERKCPTKVWKWEGPTHAVVHMFKGGGDDASSQAGEASAKIINDVEAGFCSTQGGKVIKGLASVFGAGAKLLGFDTGPLGAAFFPFSCDLFLS